MIRGCRGIWPSRRRYRRGRHADAALSSRRRRRVAPERADGNDADNRSDIYSLGIIAYYMFSGTLPYIGKPMEVLAKHRDGNAPPITKVYEQASPEVSRLIVRMMAVDPTARPQSMEAVRDEVKDLLDLLELPDAI